MKQELIACLDHIKFDKKTKSEDEYDIKECVICIDEFTEGNKILRIPTCKHFFHYECGKKWFDSENQEDEQKCPMCNKEINVNELMQLKGIVRKPSIVQPNQLQFHPRDGGPSRSNV